jgi:phospho-N-acetylmuramoyl-pentapeptide-transferase
MTENISEGRGFQPTGVQLLYVLGFFTAATVGFLDWQLQHSVVNSLLIPFIGTALAVAALGFWAVPWLSELKMGQFIREDGPQAHLKKAGTPTMGGIFVVPVGLIAAIIWSNFQADVLAVSFMTASYLAIGGIDDWKSLRNGQNEGLTPKGKLALQIGAAVVFCIWAATANVNTITRSVTTVRLPFGLMLPLGIMFWALAVFVLLAESNATNLTDGVDGLAGGTGSIALLGMAAVTGVTHPALALFCVCLSGSYLGFLVHNRNKARVFMGDTGSLALGGALGAVGILSGNLWALFILSGIFFVESLSVISQVGYYKATKGPDGKGKRLFKMAPFHHHLELSGWAETQVVGVFYVVGALLAIICWLTRVN